MLTLKSVFLICLIQVAMGRPGDLDFSSSSWISKMVPGQTVSRTVDGNEFKITGDGKRAIINGFPVTEAQWNEAIGGKTVPLKSEDGKEGVLSSENKNVKLDGKPISDGMSISMSISFKGPSSSLSSLLGEEEASKDAAKVSSNAASYGSHSDGSSENDWDFTSPSWITKLGPGQTLVRVVDGNGFIINGDGKTATINGFPVTEKEWQDAKNGQPVTLKSGDKEAKLTVSGKNVSLDGKSITDGAQIANCMSLASSSPANTSSDSSTTAASTASNETTATPVTPAPSGSDASSTDLAIFNLFKSLDENTTSPSGDSSNADNNSTSTKGYSGSSSHTGMPGLPPNLDAEVDFTTSDWITKMVPGQTINRNVDGTDFKITGGNNTANINGFPVTVDDYKKVLGGENVTLKADGKEAVLSGSGKNIMLDGKSITDGSTISMGMSYRSPMSPMAGSMLEGLGAGPSSGSSSSSGQSSHGMNDEDTDYTTSTWITKMVPGQTITRKVDNNEFIITGDGKTAIINGFPVTVAEWDTLVKGQEVTLKKDGKEAKLTFKDKNVMMDGKSINVGSTISVGTKFVHSG